MTTVDIKTLREEHPDEFRRRYEDWARSGDNYTKEKKEVTAQKWSHFCTALEAVFKDFRFKPRRTNVFTGERMRAPEYKYFARPR